MSEPNDQTHAGRPALRKSRRHLTAEKKFQIYLEAQRGDQAVGEILRREGLYSSDLTRIRKPVTEGALERLRVNLGPHQRSYFCNPTRH